MTDSRLLTQTVRQRSGQRRSPSTLARRRRACAGVPLVPPGFALVVEGGGGMPADQCDVKELFFGGGGEWGGGGECGQRGDGPAGGGGE